MTELALDLQQEAVRAQQGNIDANGDVVDLRRVEHLRRAIDTEGPEPAERQLRRVLSLIDGRGS